MPKQEVTLKQITYTASAMIIGTSILTKQLYTFMRHEAWVAIVSGVVVCLLIFQIYGALVRSFPGLSLIEISGVVFGRVIGKIVSALYVYFIFTIACLNVNVLSNLVKGYILPSTPAALILFLFVFICAMAVRRGPRALMRYGVLLMVLAFVILLTITVLLIPDMDIKNLLPVFSLPAVNYAVGTHSISLIPLCDPFFMLMFTPYVKRTNAFIKVMIKGLLIGAAFLLVIVVRDTVVLGRGLEIFGLPSLLSVRMIDVGDILTRIDIIYFVLILMLLFYKVSLLFYAAASGIRRLLKAGSHKTFVNILGALMLIYGLTVFASASEHSEWLENGAAQIHHMFFLVLMPLVTLVVAAFRGFIKKGSASVEVVADEGSGSHE